MRVTMRPSLGFDLRRRIVPPPRERPRGAQKVCLRLQSRRLRRLVRPARRRRGRPRPLRRWRRRRIYGRSTPLKTGLEQRAGHQQGGGEVDADAGDAERAGCGRVAAGTCTASTMAASQATAATRNSAFPERQHAHAEQLAAERVRDFLVEHRAEERRRRRAASDSVYAVTPCRAEARASSETAMFSECGYCTAVGFMPSLSAETGAALTTAYVRIVILTRSAGISPAGLGKLYPL